MVSEARKQRKRILGLTYLDKAEKLQIYVPTETDFRCFKDGLDPMYPSAEEIAKKAIREAEDHFPSEVRFYTNPKGWLHHLKNGALNHRKLVPSLFNGHEHVADYSPQTHAKDVLEVIWETGYQSYIETSDGNVSVLEKTRSFHSKRNAERARKIIASYAKSNPRAQVAPLGAHSLPISLRIASTIRHGDYIKIRDGKYKK
jgi:hypothetical protein